MIRKLGYWLQNLRDWFFVPKDPLDELIAQVLAVDWSPYAPVFVPGNERRPTPRLRPEEHAYAVAAMIRRTPTRQQRRRLIARNEAILREALRRLADGTAMPNYTKN